MHHNRISTHKLNETRLNRVQSSKISKSMGELLVKHGAEMEKMGPETLKKHAEENKTVPVYEYSLSTRFRSFDAMHQIQTHCRFRIPQCNQTCQIDFNSAEQ